MFTRANCDAKCAPTLEFVGKTPYTVGLPVPIPEWVQVQYGGSVKACKRTLLARAKMSVLYFNSCQGYVTNVLTDLAEGKKKGELTYLVLILCGLVIGTKGFCLRTSIASVILFSAFM